MTKREQRHAELLARGFERLPSDGSNFTSYRRDTRAGIWCADLGPRGSVSCWLVTLGNGSAASQRIAYDTIIDCNLRLVS